jgi:Ser/Thr protein kinase RdoA (MazF antagonist)
MIANAAATNPDARWSVARGRPVPEAFGSVLAWLTSELPLYLGQGAVQLTPVEYQERPFSHLLRVAVSSERESAARRMFVKIFKSTGSFEDTERMRRRVEHDFERTREIHRAMSVWPDLRVVTPVACHAEHLATVTEEAPGRPLFEHLRAHVGWLPAGTSVEPGATMERIGRWIRAFQAAAPSGGSISLDGLRGYVDVRLSRLTTIRAAGFDAADRRRVLSHIDRLGALADPGDFEEAPIHGDLALGNILVSPGHVTVLDFAMAGIGSRLHDLSRLFVQVELMALKPQMRTASLKRANRALLSGFDASLTPERPMFRLLSMLHRVNHFLTLSTSRRTFPESAYNWHVRRHHRAWMMRELRESELSACR